MFAGLRTGLGVFTKDGKDVGKVGELRATEFKVDAPMAFDFWLPETAIDSIQHDVVLLKFGEAELAERKHEPGAASDESAAPVYGAP